MILREVFTGTRRPRRRRFLAPAFMGFLAVPVLFLVACGSDDQPAEPVATASPAPPPEQLSFADGRFTVNFLYRDDPTIVSAIETVDVVPILESALTRIDSLVPGERLTVNFLDTQPFQYRTHRTSGLTTTMIERLLDRGFVATVDGANRRLDMRIDPSGPVPMEAIWNDIVPQEIAATAYIAERFGADAGLNFNSLLDIVVGEGLGLAFQSEAFPVGDGVSGNHMPEFAEFAANMSAEAEREYWSMVEPELDNFSVSIVQRFNSPNGDVPLGTTAALGLKIVQAYQDNNPGAIPSTLINVRSEEIFAGSDYGP